jgi:hypothetical protein
MLVIVSLLVMIPNQVGAEDPVKLDGLPTDGNYNYVILADMNNDGYLDIVTGAGGYPGDDPGGLYVYVSNKGDSFTKTNNGLPGPGKDYFGSVQAVDIDKDGNLDIVGAFESHWSRGNDKGIGIWLGDGASGTSISFTKANTPIDKTSFDAAYCADINSDGKLDLVGASESGIYAWEGKHSGSTLSWTEVRTGLPTTGEYTGAMLGDVNNDGRLDIVAGSYQSKGISIYLCSGSGSISWSEGHSDTDLKTTSNSFEMFLTDLDGDSNLDIVAGFRGGIRAYLGNGNSGDRGTWWTDVSQGFPTSGDYYQIAVADLDSDGKPEVSSAYKVWSNSGRIDDGSTYKWSEMDIDTSVSTSVGIAIADLNKDGYLDIVGCGWDIGVRAYQLFIEPLEENEYKVSGKIIDQKTGKPIKDALIKLDNGGAGITTGSDGRYELQLKNGLYELTISKNEYKTSKKVFEVSGIDLTLDIQLIPITGEPEAKYILSGLVKNDESGDPIDGANVTLEPGDITVKTKSDGKYEITVTNGSYVMTITAPDYYSKTFNVDINGGDVVKDLAVIKKDQLPGYGDEPEEDSLPLRTILMIAGVFILIIIILIILVRRKRKKVE